ncbi:MAG: hypothetical protein EZS28_019486 [Streblomastix strix]|uniref:Uncharacterized protein n=1 Tax=Streblomastix strix TaxID=222440 RepID=A0A5J4VQQ5_9EUKA|nr:MAG: hypothetical protein EZS28_019486 [Streblomastix strix]
MHRFQGSFFVARDIINRSKSSCPKSSAKRVGRPSNQPKAQYAKEYSEKKQKYIHKSHDIDPRSVAKVPQILHDIGQLQTVQGRLNKGQYEQIIHQIIETDPTITIEEADAAIQGFKGKVRQQRIYGGYNPQNLIESNIEAQQMVNQYLVPQQQQLTQQADADTNQNINDRYNQPSHDVSSKIQPSEPDPSIYDSEDERMEKFGGYNRWQEKPQNSFFNPFESNTDQFTDFAQQTDSLQQDIDQEKAQNQQQKQLIQDNKETKKDLEYIGGLDWGQKPVNPWYGKFPNEPHKLVDYKVTDQGALTARQRKILLSKEDRLNMDRPKTQKIATKRIILSIKAQEQLKNKLKRKKK